MYAWELASDDDLLLFGRDLVKQRRVADRYLPYIWNLLEVLAAHWAEVDQKLRDTIPNWRLERLAVIERNILRIGTVELQYVEDVPGKVAISEAIKLAEKYGSNESPRFVNGVLDAIYRRATVSG